MRDKDKTVLGIGQHAPTGSGSYPSRRSMPRHKYAQTKIKPEKPPF